MYYYDNFSVTVVGYSIHLRGWATMPTVRLQSLFILPNCNSIGITN